MAKVIFFFLLCFFSIRLFGQARKFYSDGSLVNSGNKDTSFIAKILRNDSIYEKSTGMHRGGKYYYSIHHLKIVLIDPANGMLKDTLVIGYVYNIRSEHTLYMKNFDLESGKSYVFDVCFFWPCNSDFPRLQGICDESTGEFYPESDQLIKHYNKIYRVINAWEWGGVK